MPKVKVPERLQQLAGELHLNLGDGGEFTTEPEELIAWLRDQNEAQRVEENEHRDNIDNELDELEAKMLEAADDLE